MHQPAVEFLSQPEQQLRFYELTGDLPARREAWSSEPWFRWGFGFGLSYAAKIPISEQREQEKEGKNTSHLLTYMEMQLDVPLRRFIKARAVRNCYAGVTVVHRSGIFGRSNLLGDVSGGSDWITMHLECARL